MVGCGLVYNNIVNSPSISIRHLIFDKTRVSQTKGKLSYTEMILYVVANPNHVYHNITLILRQRYVLWTILVVLNYSFINYPCKEYNNILVFTILKSFCRCNIF